MESLRSHKTLFLLFVSVLLLLIVSPSQVVGDSDSECNADDEGHNKSLALKYKLGSIASIFVASLIGVLLPIVGKNVPSLNPESGAFFVIKAFAAGVILATGFIHVLPDAFESLTSPCLPESPWGDFPFTGFVSMVAAIGTLMVDVYATSHYKKAAAGGEKNNPAVAAAGDGDGVLPLHTHATHGHAHSSIPVDTVTTQLRYRIISQVLELGIIVHSVIIGIALGASNSPKTIRPLIGALTFHQFFEGIGLGGCITQAKFKGRAISVMAVFFSLTTPVGIAIGIGISNVYDENSPNALIVEGIFDAASAGILIYMALVDLLSADFMNPKMQSSGKLMMACNASLLFGAGCMSLLAKWA